VCSQACVTHNDNAEAFSNALEETSTDLMTVRKSWDIATSQRSTVLVIELYSAVVKLLFHALDWYTNRLKRLGDAFKKNSTQKIEAFVSDFKKRLDRLRLAAVQETQWRIKETHSMALQSLDVAVQTQKRVQDLSDSLKDIQSWLPTANENVRHADTGTVQNIFVSLANIAQLRLGCSEFHTMRTSGEAVEYGTFFSL
jgi:hypothetical protein